MEKVFQIHFHQRERESDVPAESSSFTVPSGDDGICEGGFLGYVKPHFDTIHFKRICEKRLK